MLIIYKIENGIAFYYNITTNTWEKNPRKGTLIKDVDVAYKLRNALNNMGFGNGSVKWVKEKYCYKIWGIGEDGEIYDKEYVSYVDLNERKRERDKVVDDFYNKVKKEKNTKMVIYGINFIRKEYCYEECP